MTDLRQVTLTVITYDSKILLGMKKRGLGKDRWNGFGGKPQKGEKLEDCLLRETREEAGIDLDGKDIELVAVLDFYFTNRPEDWDQQAHVYRATRYRGTPVETEEMDPKEFALNDIPYNRMWPGDIHWLPLVLNGKLVRGSITFTEELGLADFELQEVEQLP
jgi:8-oxo-dGTP pyrophosphatase MutT (NUDIX family)